MLGAQTYSLSYHVTSCCACFDSLFPHFHAEAKFHPQLRIVGELPHVGFFASIP